jgi:hypothetical protein
MTVNAPIDIMNIANVILGQRSGTSRSENTKATQFANDRYESIRDNVLTQGLWNCATTRAQLSVLSTSPPFGFANQYALPSDFLRFKRFQEDNFETPFAIEAVSNGDGTATRVLLTDFAEANILYIFRLTEVAKMDELLKYAIGARLAQEIALGVKGDLRQSGFAKGLADEAISMAQFIDADQASTEVMQSTLWLNSRLTGGTATDLRPFAAT